VCVCLRATECRKFCRPKARNVFEKGRKKECVLKGQRKECVWKGTQEECVPFLMRVGTCKGTEGKVFANICQRALTERWTLGGRRT
jgi:hypothetical protein